MQIRRFMSSAAAAAGLAASLAVAVLPAGPAAAEEVFERPPDGVYVVDGHGFGHGRGLSQWGAQGAAGAGVGYSAILDSYFPGTTHTGGATGSIRVLVTADEGADLLVSAANGLGMTDARSAGHWSLPVGPAYWRFLPVGGALVVQSSDGATWTDYAPGGIASFAGPLQFDLPPTPPFTALVPITVILPGGIARDYRGAVLAALTSATTLATVNVATLEDYLRGVVPRETPSWFHADALRAQAVASRSYAVYRRDHADPSALWDLCDTSSCQVYGGLRESGSGGVSQYEQANTDGAVAATAAVVRTYGGATILAEFSSSSGGWTTGSAGLPYLSAHADPYDGLDKRNTSFAWSTTIPVTAIEAAFPALGRLARVRVIDRDGNGEWGGRVGAVTLEGTDSAGGATAVSTTGTAFFEALPWPARADGLRSNWWQIRPIYDATIAAISDSPTAVRPPAVPGASYVDVTNTGRTTWDPAAVHLTVASSHGSADPLTGGDTTPGSFLTNLTTGDGSAVQPGQQARIAVGWSLARVAAGAYTPSYQLMIGSAAFGPAFGWTVTVREPVFAAATGAQPELAPAGTRPTFSPAPVQSGGIVAVPRSGRTVVRLTFRNTGNLAWPLLGPVQIGTSGPNNRRSAAAGLGWISPTRAARISGVVGKPAATEVAPGETGFADVTLWGNNRKVGLGREVFDLLWEGKRWLGVPVTLHVTHVDTSISRLAELVSAPPTVVRLVEHPAGQATLALQLRNLGGTAWRVGGTDVVGVVGATDRTPMLRTAAWISATRATRLVRNVSRADRLVYPGEIGEWRVPLSAVRKLPGLYGGTFQVIDTKSNVAYGPKFTTRATVARGVFAGSVVASTPKLVLPRTGRQNVIVDVRNTGNFSWQVGGPVRIAVPARGGSPSRTVGWLKPLRPAALTSNRSVNGLRVVRPGQVGRFSFAMAGNNRKPGRYTEKFSVVWEGWKAAPVTVLLTYVVR